ncbi:U4/U6.U5 tri-snRNP-associated protein 1 isoform X2 [Planococcus citri]|uniref:U4/U6.U5 tri-snRNP-associated protein 1 isoform X2 n=1 Tax=Planococcus citri TaxID=170843 RepID=UPI0031F87E45
MGSNKHKHKSKKRKHYRSSESSERELEKERRHHKKHSRDKKEKHSSSKSILVDDYDSSDSDDVIIVTTPPPPKISRNISPSPPPAKRSRHSHAPTPPPAVIRRRSPSPPPASSTRESRATTNSSAEASLSIEETNKIRLKLGLKPLDVSSAKPQENDKEKKETFGGTDMGEFVHKPAENIATKTFNEKLKEKIALKREKRLLEQKLAKVKTLGDEDDSDDDVSKWVEKNRKIVNEKEQAEKKAKELDALDEVFGIGDLIEEDKRVQKRFMYTSKDLKGLKVGHSTENFVEGRDVILTLEDKGILEDEEDTLVNVNIQDDERYKKNIDRRKRKPGYNAYDDSAELEEELLDDKKKVLTKYDEEIDGEKKSSFKLGVNAKMEEEARKEAIRKKLQERQIGKRLETLAMSLTPASEYYTEQEIQIKFKKPKKKVRKIRKKILKADDLLRDDYSMKDEPEEDPSLRGIGTRRPKSRSKIKTEVKDEPMDELDFDDLPVPPLIDTSKIKIEDEDDDQDLQLALDRARKLKQERALKPSAVETSYDEDMEDVSKTGPPGSSIVLNATAEFCRTLGDIPTYGQAGNREEDAQELLDFERELQKERMRREEIDALTTGWNEVAMDSTPVDITPAEVPILDAEPDIVTGVAGALKMAIVKGYVQNENEKRPSASRFAHLQAQNYSIEDKAHSMEDDKHARRERYCGPTSDFKEKAGYKPNVKLDYIDDDGHKLSAKEAFRYLSHKFHGKGPGKNKIEKRMKKGEQDALMKQMSSTDTPLGTLSMLQQKQKETASPFVVLSGSKHGHSTAISKLKM